MLTSFKHTVQWVPHDINWDDGTKF